jgi:hypothetical protein
MPHPLAEGTFSAHRRDVPAGAPIHDVFGDPAMIARRLAAAALALFATSTTACYHAVIETGRPESATVINQPWAMSFVYGLVPPPAVNTASTCPNGVARVDTQHSFLNGLVAAVTFGIVTPMTITVTCASSGGGADNDAALTVNVAATATAEQKADAVNAAARLAAQNDGTAYVQF